MTTQSKILTMMKNALVGKDANDYKMAEPDRLAALLRLTEDEKLKLDSDKQKLQQELETYKHAFESTAIDRDIWQERSMSMEARMEVITASYCDLYAQTHPQFKQPLAVYGLPNFFCVGVQKTATSFLYSVLRDHPLVKTVAKDTGALKRFVCGGSIEKYREELEGESNAPVFAHFDVNVIDCPDSALAIRGRLCHDARILICVRNPIDRAISEWKMRARTIRPSGLWAEPLEFLTAIEKERERDPVYYGYMGRSLYADAIQSYFNTFGRENVHVIVMEEDLGERTPLTLIELFGFVSLLDQDAVKISMLGNDQYYQASKGPSRVDIDYDGKTLKITSDRPSQLNTEVIDPTPDFVETAKGIGNKQAFKLTDKQAQDLFKRYFENDVAALEKLLERDLSCWRP